MDSLLDLGVSRVRVLEGLLRGERLEEICGVGGVPDLVVVMGWFASDAGFRECVLGMLRAKALYESNRMLDIADGRAVGSGVSVGRDKLGVETRKWLVERLESGYFSGRSVVEHVGRSFSKVVSEMDDSDFAPVVCDVVGEVE